MMAGGAFFDITVTGKGSHGARPEEGIDPVLTACHITTALQAIVSRNISPRDTAVLSVTSIQAGDAYNVIPQTAVIWQGIHISPQSDRGAIAGSENADDTGLADIAMNLTAELGKLAGDELGRAMLLEAKLGVCMQVLPPAGHFAVKCFDAISNLHREDLDCRMGCSEAKRL